ncbi:MAG: heavy metal-binding domain-containing protein [Kiritimatiellae bacterium]|nr:heavy metal-binding domain-containing protein [Kiritimatiellia bacterium]
MDVILQFIIYISILFMTYCIGSYIEHRHFQSIRIRENQTRDMMVITFSQTPEEWKYTSTDLVCGNIVISLDYFKRFLAALRTLVGGPIKSYEPLLDRARREAILRMKEQALSQGYDAIINARLETSRLASSGGDGKGTSGIEVLAFGTGLKLLG